MPRTLDTATLDGAARAYAAAWLQPTAFSAVDPGLPVAGRGWVERNLYEATFKDEHAHLVAGVRDWLGRRALEEFNKFAKDRFEPRRDDLFHHLLETKLAIDPDGNHLPGRRGTTIVGSRLVGTGGRHMIEVETPDSIRLRKIHRRRGLEPPPRETHWREAKRQWNVYAGEIEERLAGAGPDVVDPLPPGTPGLPVGATNTRISNECAILGCDAIVDNLDEGTGAAVIQGRSGAQPADPDTATTGTNLFTLVCSDPAFNGAADDDPGATAAADTITADSSADATNTLGYCRASSTNDGATPLDDHIDGEAGTSSADWIFNTLSIVAGATVSVSSWAVTLPES